MSVIKTNNLQKHYQVGENSVHAVDGVDLNVREGEFVCISGRSGSGKSTLLSLLAGLESPTDGEVVLLGEHLEQMNERERGRFRREHIGFIFQAYNLLPQFNSWENVAIPLEIRGVPLEERKKKAMEALEMVDLADHAEHRPTGAVRRSAAAYQHRKGDYHQARHRLRRRAHRKSGQSDRYGGYGASDRSVPALGSHLPGGQP